MKFSILVPVYNAEKYLSSCIDSILGQNYSDFELVLVVDGATDNSANICINYEKTDSRVRVIEKENGGVTSARIEAANKARGDYVLCVDGDDYINSELLSVLSNCIEANPDIDMICFGYNNENDGIISGPIYHDLVEGISTNIDYLTQRYLYNRDSSIDNNGVLGYALWTKCIKREIYVKSQNNVPLNVVNGDDALCTAWMLSLIKKYAVIKYPGYFYRNNPNSLTHIRKGYDLVNHRRVTSELSKIGIYPKENVGHYYLLGLYVLLRDMARCSINYNEYKEFLKYLDFNAEYSSLRFFEKYGIKSVIRYNLIQKQMWKTLYTFVKVFSL